MVSLIAVPCVTNNNLTAGCKVKQFLVSLAYPLDPFLRWLRRQLQKQIMDRLIVKWHLGSRIPSSFYRFIYFIYPFLPYWVFSRNVVQS